MNNNYFSPFKANSPLFVPNPNTPFLGTSPSIMSQPVNPSCPMPDHHMISEIMSGEHSMALGQIVFAPNRIINAVGVCVTYYDKNKNLKTASTIAGTSIRYGYEGDISVLKNTSSPLRSLPSDEYRNIVSVVGIQVVHDIPLIIDDKSRGNVTRNMSIQELEGYIAACTTNNLGYLFQECDNLVEVSSSALDTVPVEKADFMFAGCRNLNSDFVFCSTLTSCVGMFAGCSKMNGDITFNSNPNISGIFYGTTRGLSDKVHGLNTDVLLNNFSHLIQPYTDLMKIRANVLNPTIPVNTIQRVSGWGDVDVNIFAKPVNAYWQEEPDFSDEEAERDHECGNLDSTQTQEKSKDNS